MKTVASKFSSWVMRETTSRKVCDHCSKIKQRCDGGDPCYRCARLSLECHHTRVQKASFKESDNSKSLIYDRHGSKINCETKRRAAVIKRTRNGCTSCKLRKKKCDEVLPKCGDCKRLNLECNRTQPRPLSSVLNPYQNGSGTSGFIREFSARGGVEFGQTEESFPHFPVPISSESPENETISCHLSDESESITYSKVSALTQSQPPLPFDRISLQPPFKHLDTKDQHLLRHFTRVVARTLSVVRDDDFNPFLSLIVPLAGSSKVVQESLLALSASHLRRIYPEVLQRGLTHQNEALASLSSLIRTKSPESPEETLAAVLLLCMLEICDGNSTKWSWHIRAAQAIIRSNQKSLNSNTSTWKFLLAMFGYVDSVITISKCQAPLIAPEELAQDGGSSGSSPGGPLIPVSKSHNEALFGAALPLFTLISQISELAHRRKDRVDEISELWFRQSALRIEMNLRAWKPNLHVSCRCFSSCTSQSCKSEDLIDAAYAIQWASILRLHQVVEGYNRSDCEVVECTAKILEYISRIRFGSSAESILIFPLVMAGSGVQDDEQRMMVRERWMVMERTIGFDNIYRARQMVEAVWKEMDKGKVDGTNDGGLKVNWAKIRYYDFPGVVLL